MSAPSARPAPGPLFLATLASLSIIGPLAVHLFVPVMPEVKRAFDISKGLAGLTFSVALFVMAFTTLVYGALSDRFGRRPVLLASLALFLVGTAVATVATTIEVFMVGRVLQAAGAGGGGTLARAIAHDTYGVDRAVKVFAYLTMAYTLGPMVSPFLGGLLIDFLSWRGVFWFALVVGGVIAAAAWWVIDETRKPHAPGKAPVSLLAAYRTLLRLPLMWAFILQSGMSTAAFMALITGASFLMQDYLQRPAAEYGAYFALFPLGFLFGSWVASRLAGRISVPRMILAGSLLMSVGASTQAGFLLFGTLSPLVLFLPGILLTIAQGLALPNAQSGAMRLVPSLAGTAAGLGTFSQMFLGALGAQIYAMVSDGSPRPLAFTVAGFCSLTLVFGVIQYRLQRRP